jgi:hypothetical protein
MERRRGLQHRPGNGRALRCALGAATDSVSEAGSLKNKRPFFGKDIGNG